MSAKIIRFIGAAIDRRQFLGKMTASAGALVAGVFVAPKPAYACGNCCHLCFASSGCSGQDCSWAWTCSDDVSCHYYWCEEFIHLLPHNQCTSPCGFNNYCGGGCASAGVYCSQATMSGQIPGCRAQ
jgi:hypothetical protein